MAGKTALDWALAYADGNIAVFPLLPRTKVPMARYAPHGFKNATTDRDDIRRVWTRHPEAGIGGVPPDDMCVFDIDAEADLRAMVAGGWQLPTTAIVKTGRGWHFWYWTRKPVATTKLVGKTLLRGGDAKGYLVMPPSIHPSGWQYRFMVGLERMVDAV